MQSWTFGTLTPGAGVIEPSRNTMMMNSTNSSFRRRSGVLNALTKAPSTRSSHLSRCYPVTSFVGTLTVGVGNPTGRTVVVTVTSHGRDSAATRLDLLLRRSRERVGRHLHCHRDLTGPQDLDRLLRPNRTLGGQRLDGHLTAVRVELGQPVQVDDLETRLERAVEAPHLGQPHVDRQLAALEARRNLVAGLRALGAATGGFASPATLAATDSNLGGLRAGRRTQMMQLERHLQSTSSTTTRWGTVAIMPRISGRSSFTTTSPIRFRPSERNVSR